MKLIDYLKQENLRVQDFATDCGLTRMTIYNLINKIAPPRKSTVKLISMQTKGLVTLEDLIYTKRGRPKKLDAKSTNS